MKRNFRMTEKIKEAAENNERARVEVERNASDRALEQVSRHLASREIEPPYACEPTSGFTRQAESELQAGPSGGFEIGSHYHRALIGRLHERLPAFRLRRPRAEPIEEQGTTNSSAEGAQSEVERMLKKVLDADGGEIAEWLKEQEAEIAAATCTEPEIGGIIEAFYIPLLLSTLALDDEEFNTEYPGERRVSSEQRAEFADAILQHSQDCPRCSLKATSDWRWDEHIDKLSVRNRNRRRVPIRV